MQALIHALVADDPPDQLDQLEQLEGRMLQLPQAPCPVVHHFAPGLYIREVRMSAGTLAIGHRQRTEHYNILLRGRVLMQGNDGGRYEVAAPLAFVAPPGRKVGYVLEDVVWLNVYATNERDIDKLEATYLVKSPTWNVADAERRVQERAARQPDRDDHRLLLEQVGITPEVARAQAENVDDMVPMPASYSVRILPSPIEGLGLFVSAPVEAGQVIAPARIGGMRTPAGRFTNHSATPNARMVHREQGRTDIDLVALRRIEGCAGGEPGEEVTIDYRQALALSGIHIKGTP